MFNWLKNLFKEKNCIFISITPEILNNKRNICYGELFKNTEIKKYIDILINSSEIKKYHYKNIQANEQTILNLEKVMKKHLLTTKNKWSKLYKTKKLESIFSFDCLMYAPYKNDNIPNNKIKILLPGHKDFIYITKKDI